MALTITATILFSLVGGGTEAVTVPPSTYGYENAYPSWYTCLTAANALSNELKKNANKHLPIGKTATGNKVRTMCAPAVRT